MEKQFKLLIAEENEEFRGHYGKILAENNFALSWSPKHGVRVLQAICENIPDAVVVDAFMPCLDSVALIRQIDEMGVENKPKVLVMLPFENEDLRVANHQAGAAGFLAKPINPVALLDELKRIFNTANPPEAQFVNFQQKTQKSNFLEIKVTEILHQIGVPAHIKGYHYLRESIIMAIETPEIINAVTRKLYPSVARTFDTTSSRVERAIRHAIEVAWDRGDIEVLNSYFGYTIHNARGKPTNSEFVAMISDKLRLQIKNAS